MNRIIYIFHVLLFSGLILTALSCSAVQKSGEGSTDGEAGIQGRHFGTGTITMRKFNSTGDFLKSSFRVLGPLVGRAIPVHFSSKRMSPDFREQILLTVSIANNCYL